jgi:hypothetical protein
VALRERNNDNQHLLAADAQKGVLLPPFPSTGATVEEPLVRYDAVSWIHGRQDG